MKAFLENLKLLSLLPDVALVALVSCAEIGLGVAPVNAGAVDDELFAYVERIVDGDSLYLRGSDKQIRLWGVDAPERDERGYRDATKTLKALAGERQLRCEIVDIDKYERLVCRCFRRDGREVNRLMLESGTAQEYCFFSRGHYGFCPS